MSTAKMRKGVSMKFLCIISGCPAGARKWHIFSFFLCVCIEKRAHLPPTGKCAQTVGDEYDMPLLHVVLH